MYVSSNSNIVFPCKVCNININNKHSAIQCDICQFWIHIKCNKLNHIDYKYVQGSNDPWYCISCCDQILPFGTLTNKNLALVNPPINSKDLQTKEIFHEQYKDYRNMLSTLLKKGKANYYNQYFEANMNNTKNTWKGIKSIIT